MTRPPHPGRAAERPIVDVFELARAGDRLEGVVPVAGLPRLAASLRDARGVRDTVAWSAQGSTGTVQGGGHASWLDLSLDFDAPLPCGRCLETVVLARSVRRRFKLEYDAAAVEAEPLDEDQWDALLGSRAFDLLELVEDEALLALPYAPAHEACALPAGADQPAADARPNPFAALAALRGRRDDEPSS